MTVIALLLPAACLIALFGLLAFALGRERSDLRTLMMLIIVSVIVMSASFILELLSESREAMIVWNFTFYVGFIGAIVSLFLYGFRVLNLQLRFARMLAVFPALSLFLLLIDPWTGLFYSSITVEPFSSYTYLSIEPGLGFSILVVIGVLLTIYLFLVLGRELFSNVAPSLNVVISMILIPSGLLANFLVNWALGEPFPTTYGLLAILTILISVVLFLPSKKGRRVRGPTYQNVLQSLEVGVAVANMEGDLLYINREGESHLAKKEGERLPGELRDILDSYGDGSGRQDLHADFGGGPAHFDVRVEALQGGDGSTIARLLVMDDVTARVDAHDVLLKTQEKLSILNGVTRHDVSNQLTVILGYGELLRQQCNFDEESKAKLDAIMRAAEAIIMQTEFMLDYQNVGQAEPYWQSLRSSLERAQSQAAGEPLELQLEGVDVELFADPMLHRVFLNLMQNTLQHSEGPGMAKMSISRKDDWLELIYEDQGVGIALKDKERIFKRGLGRGSGMGLFLSRAILAISSIEIREEGEPGVGVRFVISVPPGSHRPA